MPLKFLEPVIYKLTRNFPSFLADRRVDEMKAKIFQKMDSLLNTILQFCPSKRIMKEDRKKKRFPIQGMISRMLIVCAMACWKPRVFT
jgi:hypothetical protein